MHIAVTSSFLIYRRASEADNEFDGLLFPISVLEGHQNRFFFSSYGYYVQSSPLTENPFSETCLGQCST